MLENDLEQKFYYSTSKLIKSCAIFASILGLGIFCLQYKHPPGVTPLK